MKATVVVLLMALLLSMVMAKWTRKVSHKGKRQSFDHLRKADKGKLKRILSSEKNVKDIADFFFKEADTDKDGLVDEEDLMGLMKKINEKIGIELPTKEEIMEIFEDLDEDDSGELSFSEFKVLAKDVLEKLLHDQQLPSLTSYFKFHMCGLSYKMDDQTRRRIAVE
eukprot:TRINITY_DN72706_c0_g1_i1.p1 TRINITY_DN72706_c0_g1~~TRINITY_DN72706_c0_g1_i1.p1  ORF type:complete len:167 (+),score=26.08 TRINITY_DN72706_c0_g1_i1:242-742(+)